MTVCRSVGPQEGMGERQKNSFETQLWRGVNTAGKHVNGAATDAG